MNEHAPDPPAEPEPSEPEVAETDNQATQPSPYPEGFHVTRLEPYTEEERDQLREKMGFKEGLGSAEGFKPQGRLRESSNRSGHKRRRLS